MGNNKNWEMRQQKILHQEWMRAGLGNERFTISKCTCTKCLNDYMKTVIGDEE